MHFCMIAWWSRARKHVFWTEESFRVCFDCLGLSQYHSLEDADESTLSALNDFGGQQKALLTYQGGVGYQRNLIVIDSVENPEEITKTGFPEAALKISNPPHVSHTLQLVRDLFRQAQKATPDIHFSCSFRFNRQVGINGGLIQLSEPTPCGSIMHSKDGISLLRAISSPLSSRTLIAHIKLPDAISSDGPEASNALSQALADLLRPGSGHETTVLLMPPSTQKSKLSSTSPYGSYEMPVSAPLHPRKIQSEALLTAPSSPQTSLASHHHHQSTPETLKASSVARIGILPVCQSSLEKLIDATNNCSGHGLPYLKRNGTLDKTSDCYACKCRKTILSRGEGKGVKTIEWAGPACSKKDVSIPFWLLAGISIGLVAAVSWGIGLLFNIGQEDLPSVIGAGVAGPRAQK